MPGDCAYGPALSGIARGGDPEKEANISGISYRLANRLPQLLVQLASWQVQGLSLLCAKEPEFRNHQLFGTGSGHE
jgi:hypothetical protein